MGSIAKQGFGAIVATPSGDLTNGADPDTLLLNQEVAILDTTELICELMKEAGVSRADLARRMRKSKGFITQLLDGSRNMTIRTVSDIFTNLGHEFRASCKAKESSAKPVTVIRIAAEIVIPHGEIQAEPTGTHFSGFGTKSIHADSLGTLPASVLSQSPPLVASTV